MSPRQAREEHALHEAVNALEHMADLAETNIVSAGLERLEKGLAVFPGTREQIEALHREVMRAVGMAIDACAEEDLEKATTVVKMKRDVKALADEVARHQKRRLLADAPRRVETFTFENEIVESLKRVFYFARRLSREALAVPGEELVAAGVAEGEPQ
jgi:phosphate:Na+ symporter